MANFSQHLNSAALVSGVGASILLSANMIDSQTAIWLFAAGCFGGLLPDIDSDTSASMRILFSVFASFSSILTIHFLGDVTSLFTIILLATCAFITVRYGFKEAFERLTIHRATCHSLSFVTLFSIAIVCIYYKISGEPVLSWLTGLFVLLGALTHLSLDEIFSVDFSNASLKRSFGSALKVIDFNYPIISTAQVVTSIVLIVFFSPEIQTTLSLLGSWSQLEIFPNWLMKPLDF